MIAIGLLALGLFVIALLAAEPLGAAAAFAGTDRHAPAPEARHPGEPFHWDGRIAPGKTLAVRGINGPIRVEAARGGEAAVDAVKSARRSDPDQVKIEVTESVDGVTICARYPRRDGRLNECEHQQTTNNDVNVAFTVALPPGVKLSARTVNGRIEAEDLGSDVDATTVNGSIEISTRGFANAETVNGSIHSRIGSSDWGSGLSFQTVNGSIDLVMPSGIGADLSASTVNGHVNSDFPVTVTGRISSHHLNGTIGKGGPKLSLETVNGGIELHSSDRAGKSE